MNRNYLDICFRLIQKKLGWSSYENWTDKQFKDLTALIYEDSGVSISSKTLKRLTGRINLNHPNASNYNPQLATKNALAHFIGYPDWAAFIKAQETASVNKQPFPIVYVIPLIILLLFAVVYIFWPFSGDSAVSKEDVSANISFHCKNPEGYAPHNTLFSYTFHNPDHDSIFIDYQDRYHIDPGHYDIQMLNDTSGQVTYSYLMPDLYFPGIKYRDDLIKKVPVLVKSRGWVANVCFEDMRTNSYRYRLLDDLQIRDRENHRLFVEPGKLISQKDINKEHYFLEYRLIQDFGFEANDLIIETEFKNSIYEGGDNCNDYTFIGRCDSGKVKVKFLTPGCTQWAEYIVGDSVMSGNTSDMRHFGVMDNQKHTMKLDITHSFAKVYFDSTLVETISEPSHLGKLYGMIFVYKGVGSLYSVKISDHQQNVLYSTDF